MEKDELIMRQCLILGKQGESFVSPNPMVGCVIVKNNKTLSYGYHKFFGDKHAEIDALDKIKGNAKGATLYVNLEPCSHQGKTPPCVDRIISEGIQEVFIGSLDPNPLVNGRGVEKLRGYGILVKTGVIEAECREFNKMFYFANENKKAFVTLKIALSKNFCLTSKNKEKVQISNNYTSKIIHKLRSIHSGILVSANTVISDDPMLTVRNIKGKNPTRIILDREEKLNLEKYQIAKNKEANNIIIAGHKSNNPKYEETASSLQIQIIKVKEENGFIDFTDVQKQLYENNILSVLIESGVALTKNLIKNKIPNNIMVVIGQNEINNGLSPFKAKSIENLIKEIGFKEYSQRDISGDIMIEGTLQ